MYKSPCKQLAVLLFVILLAGSLPLAEAQEKQNLKSDQIPPTVMAGLKAKFPQAKIDQCTREKEGDMVIYDIEFKQGGHKFEADVKEDGTIYNWEKAVKVKDLPEAVIKAVEMKYPKCEFESALQVTVVEEGQDRLEGYEITLETAADKDAEVTVAPDGKILEDSGEMIQEEK